MSSDHSTVATISTTNRSRFTNNPRLLPGVDGRTAIARRRRDLIDAFLTDLGGAVSALKEAEVRRAAELVALAEDSRARAFRDGSGAVDMAALVRLEGMAARAQRALGLKPDANDGDFADFLAKKYPGTEIDDNGEG